MDQNKQKISQRTNTTGWDGNKAGFSSTQTHLAPYGTTLNLSLFYPRVLTLRNQI